MFFNFSAIRNYHKFTALNEKTIYHIYPKNTLLKFFLVYCVLAACYESWYFIDALVIQQKIISFKSADTFDIIQFIIDRIKDLGILVVISSTIYILTRKSIITENCIITRYGAYNINDLSNVETENNNIIKYELKEKSIRAGLAGLSFRKFTVLENEAQEIFSYLKAKIM